MKLYAGDRTIDGINVTVDGEPLDERLDLQAISGNGFEWTYEGDEPQQLALAILADHFATDNDRARRLSGAFMSAVIAKLDNTWQLSSADIDAALTKLES